MDRRERRGKMQDAMDRQGRIGRGEEDRRDRILVSRFLQGDQSAFEELYSHHQKRVYALCYRICGNPHDAADMAHDAFITTVGKLEKLEIEEFSFGGYLLVSARNACVRHRQRSSRTTAVPEVLDQHDERDQFDVEIDPERSLLLQDQREAVRDANARIANRQQQALALRELQGLSYSKIAKELGLSTNGAAQLISRARLRLKQAMRISVSSTPTNEPKCQRALSLLSKRIDGEIREFEAGWLDNHVSQCNRCKANFEAALEMGESYRVLLPGSALVTQLKRFLEPLFSLFGPVGNPAVVASLSPILVVASILVGANIGPSAESIAKVTVGSPAIELAAVGAEPRTADPSSGVEKGTSAPVSSKGDPDVSNNTQRPDVGTPEGDSPITRDRLTTSRSGEAAQISVSLNRQTADRSSTRRLIPRDSGRNTRGRDRSRSNDRSPFRPPMDQRVDDSTSPRDPVDEPSEEDREPLVEETERTPNHELDPVSDRRR